MPRLQGVSHSCSLPSPPALLMGPSPQILCEVASWKRFPFSEAGLQLVLHRGHSPSGVHRCLGLGSNHLSLVSDKSFFLVCPVRGTALADFPWCRVPKCAQVCCVHRFILQDRKLRLETDCLVWGCVSVVAVQTWRPLGILPSVPSSAPHSSITRFNCCFSNGGGNWQFYGSVKWLDSGHNWKPGL